MVQLSWHFKLINKRKILEMEGQTIITIQTDGGSRGNPGPAAYGVVIKNNEQVVYEKGQRIGIATNNVAEYSAVLDALKWVKENVSKADKILLYSDSLLLVSQLNGLYKIKNPGLFVIYNEIKMLEQEIKISIYYNHVYREKNKHADSLVNKALDHTLE